MMLTTVLFVLIYTCNAQLTITVVSSPPGDGSNGFPVSTALNLTCMITPTPSSGDVITYEWIENCDAVRDCFVNGQTTAIVGTSRLKAEDSGSYQCRPTINSVPMFSNEFTVRVTGASLETEDTDGSNAMTIGNYSYFYSDEMPPLIICRSGLLLPDENVTFLGGWYYNNQPIGGFGTCNGYLAIQPMTSNPGALPIIRCSGLTIQSEGLYTCMIRDVDLIVHELKIGLYFDRGAPRLFGPVINGSEVVLNKPILIGCLADGVPPDRFYLSKDGVVINSNYMVDIDSVNETQYSAIIQHNITSLEVADYGVYECTYTSPVQTISNSIRISGPTMPPQNFAAILVTSDSFTLSWTLLSGLEPGGLQSGYVIQCNPGDYMLMVNGSVNNIIVTGLLGHTTYSCTIFGYSQVNGPISSPLSVTTLQGAPSVPENLNVIATSSTAVMVSWQRPSMSNGIISHYTLYYYIDSIEFSVIVEYNGEMSQSEIISNLMAYKDIAINVSATTGGGEGPKTNEITVRTLADLPGYVRSVQVTGQSDTSSIVQWMPPLYPNGVITRYRLIFTNSNSTIPRNVTVDGNVMTYGVTNLAPGVQHQVLVIAENNIGSGPAVIQEFYTKQLSPTIAPQNLTIRRFSDAMFVSWNKLPAAQSRGFPIYIVRYQLTDSGNLFETSPTSENYVIIENLSPDNGYTVSVAAAVREGQELLVGPTSENVEAMAVSSSTTSCSEESDCTAMLGVAIVFIILFLICLVVLIILILYMWRQWKKIEENESQTNLTKTAFEFASRENFHLRSSQASISALNQQQPMPSSQPPPPQGVYKQSDMNEPNIYETIDKRVKNNRKREAELQRASIISTATKYESIDRQTMPTRGYTVSAGSQLTSNGFPEENSFDQDVSDPYTIGKTLERQNKPIVTDIYADSLANTNNCESFNRESLNRESLIRDSVNLEMFTPATEVINWQAPQDGPSSDQVNGKIPSTSTSAGNKKKIASYNQPEDMLTLID